MTAPSTLPARDDDFTRFAAALAGQYELECEIGRGGMGVVYRARDLRLDRTVAIKTLPPHLANDDAVRERFLREARTAGSLSHQHIVPIHRADELGGHVFFVMGYVDGESLAQRVRDRGRIDPREAVRELVDVADALRYAHARGVIHRDVKAENILIDRATGGAHVTDFGIARLAEATPTTATGQVLGTVYYLSPEQVLGERGDARADVYSLGVVAFLALGGRFPFEADVASAVLVAHVNRPAPSLRAVAPDVPEVLDAFVARCLAKDPGARFQSCAEVVDALHAAERELDRLGVTAPVRAPLVSDTEAYDILGRAAHLQAVTGIQPRPDVQPIGRDVKRDAARTSGHRVENLRDAAAEAGIPERYVDRALAERGIGAEPAPAAVPTAPRPTAPIRVVDHTIHDRPLAGAPMRFELEVVVDGEMPPEDFDILVDTIRHTAGEPGELSVVGRSLSWENRPMHGSVTVAVHTRAGKTRIRVTESMRIAAGRRFAGVVGTTVVMAIPMLAGFAAHNGLPAGTLFFGGMTLAAYAAARGLFRWHTTGREKHLRALAERLGEQARESIEYAVKKRPGGEPPR